jgi:hypothetical protein
MLKHNCSEYSGEKGHWKGQFISFGMGIKFAISIMAEMMPHFLIQLVPPKQAFSFNFGCFLSKFYSP